MRPMSAKELVEKLEWLLEKMGAGYVPQYSYGPGEKGGPVVWVNSAECPKIGGTDGDDTNLWLEENGFLRSFSFEGRTVDGVLQGVIVPEEGGRPTDPDCPACAALAREVVRWMDLAKAPGGTRDRLRGFGAWLVSEKMHWLVAALPGDDITPLVDEFLSEGCDPEGWIPIEDFPADADGDFELAAPGPGWPIIQRVYVGRLQRLRTAVGFGKEATHYRPAQKGPQDWRKPKAPTSSG